MIHDELTADAKRLIDSLASTPRFAGSDDESRARKICERHLGESGYTVAGREFQFSEWPGRWGIPLIAAATLLVIVIAAAAAAGNARFGWLLLLVGFGFILGNRTLHSRRALATQRMRLLRNRSINLEAIRGAVPRVWLVAHLDSKSQSIPMLLRVVSHVALVGVLVVEAAEVLLGQPGAVHWGWIATAGAIAALPSLFCFVGNKSRGALDNATGVAAVLLAARLIPRDRPVGVLITSGEELDLAGARAWAGGAHSGAMMLNCDTVDEKGGWRCMYAKGRNAICPAAENAAKKLGLPLRMGRMIPGIITDSLAFERGGLQSVTISRGTLQTLARLHTRGDNPDRLSGAGAATAARLLAGMVEELS